MRDAYLSGRLGKEPELVNTSSDYSLIKFDLANDDEQRKGANGEYENITSWFAVDYWTKNPKHWLSKLHKGDLVVVKCEVKQEKWKDNGANRSSIKFVISRGTYPIILEQHQQSKQQPTNQQEPDDDIPF